MSQIPEFGSLLSVILAEGKGCYCPHRDTCGYANDAWCRHIAREGGSVKILEYKDLNIAHCIYRERPGCCWVLAAVEKLAAEYLARGGVNCPPVALDLINLFDSSRRIEVQFMPLKASHGAVWLTGGEWVIQLNATDSHQVGRHTMFHEAFHIACRNASPAFKRLDLKNRPFRELLADHFATCFLMPKKWVEEWWSAVQNVRKMADIFDVSVSAMRQRLGQLGLPE